MSTNPALEHGQNLRRKSRWPARLDLLQSASGLLLSLFLIAHMGFVSSILLGKDAFYTVARFFEAGWLLGEPQPIIVSGVVAAVTALFVFHAALAMRKFPSSYRQYRQFAAHKNRLRHIETSLWWTQVWTGFAMFFLATIHLYQMLTKPELIGPYASSDRVWSGAFWPLYLILLFAVEVHGGIGLFRLANKWGWFNAKTAEAARRRMRMGLHVYRVFFLVLGLASLLAYVQIGRAHADQVGERYVPPTATTDMKDH